MSNPVPPSWQQQFDASLRRMTEKDLSPVVVRPSLDDYLEEFPLEPDQQWGEEMDALHRVALRAVVLRHVAFLSNDYEDAAARCESPPERAMLYALALIAWDYVDGVLLRVHDSASGLFSSRFSYIEIEPQAKVGKYRVDFLLTKALRRPDKPECVSRLVVECDGHEWHERTKEQARRDRARDREIQAHDLAIYRYTGSDVWRDVFASAGEAIQELNRRFEWPPPGE
ncbi:MAG: hypothetical protein ACEQSX_16735 [Baekduiaceae bacterium]